jgi:hypothetical protein
MRSSLCLQSAQPTPSLSISKSASSGEGWYLVHTLPQQKAQAEYQLRRQGFRRFLNTDAAGVSQLPGSYTLAKRSKSYQGPLVNSNASTLMVA